MSRQNIVLTGFMGTGKTTIGMLVAEKLSWRFVDTDRVIESRAGCSIPMIFQTRGEVAFRTLESEVCAEVSTLRRTVIATGGGAWIAPVNRERLTANGLVICLRASAEQLAQRLAGDLNRPLLAGADSPEARAERLEQLLKTREAVYATIPITIDTANMTPYTICERVITYWNSTK